MGLHPSGRFVYVGNRASSTADVQGSRGDTITSARRRRKSDIRITINKVMRAGRWVN